MDMRTWCMGNTMYRADHTETIKLGGVMDTSLLEGVIPHSPQPRQQVWGGSSVFLMSDLPQLRKSPPT